MNSRHHDLPIKLIRLATGLAAVTVLVASCGGTTNQVQSKAAAAHENMVAQIDTFLPKGESEASQCQYDEDRGLLNAYLSGLRTLRLSPGPDSGLASQTMQWFERDYQQCKQKMAALDQKLEEIDRRCRSNPTQIGMTAAQVIKSCWGQPEHTNRTQSAQHIREQWVYPGVGYLYFDDGILTAIQDRD